MGETILISFPDGKVGLVDAHPSSAALRPAICEVIGDRQLHFICLSHPHADHGLGLIEVLDSHHEIASFWHTLSDINSFVFTVSGEITNYRSPIREFVKQFHRGWGTFLTEIYGKVAERKIPEKKLRADLESIEVGGVKIHFLGPDEEYQNRFSRACREIAAEKRKSKPDPNLLSAIIALEFGGRVVLLGADALKVNWGLAMRKYYRLGLPKASILKVPHHGAANAMDLRSRKPNYLDLCGEGAYSVLFAGDADHPDPRVEKRLKDQTCLACLANGRKAMPASNRLGIMMPGAIEVSRSPAPCQPVLDFEIHDDGNVILRNGFRCDSGSC